VVVSRPASLRRNAACRLRPGLRAHGAVHHRYDQYSGRDPVPAGAQDGRVLGGSKTLGLWRTGGSETDLLVSEPLPFYMLNRSENNHRIYLTIIKQMYYLYNC